MTELMRTGLPTSRKVELAACALGRQGQRGAMASLARDFGVARGTVYSAKETAREVLAAHFAEAEQPPATREPAPWQNVRVDEAHVRRVVAAQRVVVPGTLRPIVELLPILFPGLSLSYGGIQAMAADAEAKAAAFNASVDLSSLTAGALDELFSQGRPVLGGIGLDCGYAFCLQLRESRSAKDWAEVLRGVKRQGLDLDLAVTDAAPGPVVDPLGLEARCVVEGEGAPHERVEQLGERGLVPLQHRGQHEPHLPLPVQPVADPGGDALLEDEVHLPVGQHQLGEVAAGLQPQRAGGQVARVQQQAPERFRRAVEVAQRQMLGHLAQQRAAAEQRFDVRGHRDPPVEGDLAQEPPVGPGQDSRRPEVEGRCTMLQGFGEGAAGSARPWSSRQQQQRLAGVVGEVAAAGRRSEAGTTRPAARHQYLYSSLTTRARSRTVVVVEGPSPARRSRRRVS